jgi:glutamate synthase (NADPH/NADH) small chain
MGKPTGFLELPRLSETSEDRSHRISHFREFVLPLAENDAAQQGARCMDCGIPYCMTGCPLNNLIPDWNDLVYQGDWKNALNQLHSTNNFPEFTARLCPAPCEEACTLSINTAPVGIKSIERAIIDKGFAEGWITPEPAKHKTGKRIAIVGSGPSGLACAQQLARAGHQVTVYEKNPEIGGLLRYGIPDFKLEKQHIDRRLDQLRSEGVVFQPGVCIGTPVQQESINNLSQKSLLVDHLLKSYDAVVLAGGAEHPRDLPIPGRDLAGIHFAMQFLTQQNIALSPLSPPGRGPGGEGAPPRIEPDSARLNTSSNPLTPNPSPRGGEGNYAISAKDKHVIVIGGGDTGSDCVGTSIRQGAASVTQLELLPMPPSLGVGNPVWPAWPVKLRTSSSHEEGAKRDWSIATKSFQGKNGQVKELHVSRLQWTTDPATGKQQMQEIPESQFVMPADLVLLAMGFTNPVASGLLSELGVTLDPRGNVAASETGPRRYHTNKEGIFTAGDMRRGQSLIVWAIREGRRCAKAVDTFLMNREFLPE